MIGPCNEVSVVFVAEPRVDGEVGSDLPAILQVEMRPIRVRIFRSAADTGLRLRGISQQKIGQRIAGTRAISRVGTTVGVDAARGVREGRSEIEMEEVEAGLKTVAPAMDQEIIEEFEIAIGPGDKTSRRTDGAESIAQRDLRIAHIGRIGCAALEPVLRSKGIAGVGIALPAGDSQPAKPKFIHDIGRKRVRFGRGHIDAVRRKSTAKAGK